MFYTTDDNPLQNLAYKLKNLELKLRRYKWFNTIDGGAFMWPILFALLFGLAFAFERAYSLVLSSIDSS